MTEICVKVFEDYKKIKEKLLSLGFTEKENYVINDLYFTHFKNYINMDYETLIKNSFIIREIEGENWNVKNLLYKDKVLDKNGNVIMEKKNKVVIENIEKCKNIFLSAGLSCWCDYSYKNCEFVKEDLIINVQCSNVLGIFLEIEESNTIKEKSNYEKFNYLVSITKSLKLKLGDDFSCKKPFLYLKTHNLSNT